MQVSELANRLNITTDTVRYYTRLGFVEPGKNPFNGYKTFSHADYKRLKFIVSARQLGFTVKDIGQILEHADQGMSACPLVRKLIEQRLEENRIQFEQAVSLRLQMESAVEQWRVLPDREPDSEMICHLIETFVANSVDDDHRSEIAQDIKLQKSNTDTVKEENE